VVIEIVLDQVQGVAQLHIPALVDGIGAAKLHDRIAQGQGRLWRVQPELGEVFRLDRIAGLAGRLGDIEQLADPNRVGRGGERRRQPPAITLFFEDQGFLVLQGDAVQRLAVDFCQWDLLGFLFAGLEPDQQAQRGDDRQHDQIQYKTGLHVSGSCV